MRCASSVVLALTACVLLTRQTAAGEPAPVKRLVKAVAFGTEAGRDKALGSLDALGPAALEPLHSLMLSTTDSKVREAAVCAWKRCAISAWENPRRRVFGVDNASIWEALGEIHVRYGVRVRVNEVDTTKKITVKSENATFIEALERVRKAASLGVGVTATGVFLKKNENHRTCSVGPLCFAATARARAGIRGLAVAEQGVEYDIFIERWAQPALRCFTIIGVELARVADSDSRGGKFERRYSVQSRLPLGSFVQIKVRAKDGAPNAFSLVRGSVFVAIPMRFEQITLGFPLSQHHRLGQCQLRCESSANGRTIQITARGRPCVDAARRQSPIDWGLALELEWTYFEFPDPDGIRIRAVGKNHSGIEGNYSPRSRIAGNPAAWHLELAETPTQLEFRAVTEVRVVEVPIEFRDLAISRVGR